MNKKVTCFLISLMRSSNSESSGSPSGHSIPLTSRRETRWLDASLRTEGWAALRSAEERNTSHRCVNLQESRSSPWLQHWHTVGSICVCLRRKLQPSMPAGATSCSLRATLRVAFCHSVRERSPACGPRKGKCRLHISSARLSSAQQHACLPACLASGLDSRCCSRGRGSVSRRPNENQTRCPSHHCFQPRSLS